MKTILLLIFLFDWAVCFTSSPSPVIWPNDLRYPHLPQQYARPNSKSQCNMAKKSSTETSVDLKSLLEKYGFDARLRTISVKDLPILAEVYLNGQSELCQIISMRATKDPTVEIQLLSGKREGQIVDIGQITTIWNEDGGDDDNLLKIENLKEQIEQEMAKFPVGGIENAMESLYKSHVGRARSQDKQPLSKKQITKVTAEISSDSERAHAEDVLRKLIKSGTGCARIVDYSTARECLYHDNGDNFKTSKSGQYSTPLQKAVVAYVLSKDASLGGRFKRTPCTFVEQTLLGESKDVVGSLSVINGGWLVVDQAIRASTDAKKFAERIQNVNNKNGKEQQTWTVSDERITQRMECLAMGEVLSDAQGDCGLEVDVREALKNLKVPTTPEGAREALVKFGRWSKEESSDQRLGMQPWSPSILEAANWYAERIDKLRKDTKHWLKEGRTDLTNIPFLCVDPKKTTFRDDAIGVRPRAGTGRKISDASKWEILISTVDVSDIYMGYLDSSDATACKNLKLLSEAAASRGISRYDLPLGPLHLLPPRALYALAFDTVNEGGSGKKYGSFNRCVTLWAYIDENTGKLLDTGIERSVISQPIALSYGDATALMEGKVDTSQDPTLKKSQQILGVAERILRIWGQNRLRKSDAAQRREERLALKEFVSKQQSTQRKRNGRSDNGSDGFERSRGHRLVDAALDLYSYTISGLLKRAKAPIPYQAGTGGERGTRVASAPLRRYVDGMAQRQALSILCNYGKPLSKQKCVRIGQEATEAYNAISNIRSVKNSNPGLPGKGFPKQKNALKNLELHLKSAGNNKIVPAISTGKANEVVISGVGAIAKCKGVKGTLKPGDQVMVKILKVDAETGSLSVTLANGGRS